MESIAVANQAATELNLTDKAFFKLAVIDVAWAEQLPHFDVVVWLSQWMWLVKQLGLEQAKEILFLVSKKCDVMVFESASADGMAAIAGTTQADIKDFLEENTAFAQIITLPPVPGWMGRNVYICQNPQLVFRQSTSIISRISRQAVKKEYLNYPQYLEREVYFLKKLAKYNITPQLIDSDKNSITMSYCGRSLYTLYPPPAARNKVALLEPQFRDILTILEKEGIEHRDLHGGNLVVLKNKVYLLDWSWAKNPENKITNDRVPLEAMGQGLWQLSGQSDQGCLEFISRGFFNMEDYQKRQE